MHISWHFLDKRKGTIEAILARGSMAFIMNNGCSDAPPVPTDEIDTLGERYRQALDFCSWFFPAWDQLSEDERFVLSTFYDGADDPADLVADRFCIERRSAYNKKNRALSHLSMLLYGRA